MFSLHSIDITIEHRDLINVSQDIKREIKTDIIINSAVCEFLITMKLGYNEHGQSEHSAMMNSFEVSISLTQL